MKRILNLSLSCFNVGLKVITRVLLIVLSASFYQSFVLVEILLNNSNVWYPKCFSNCLHRIQKYVARIMIFTLHRSTAKVMLAIIPNIYYFYILKKNSGKIFSFEAL